ncbi:MAG: hypothetical protein AAB871_03230 [Patescibacteria group bacterium]
MKLFMENKKKQLAYIGIIVVSLGAIAWLWLGQGMFGGDSAVDTNAVSNVLMSDGTASQNLQSLNSVTTLPYGKTIKTDIFSDPSFKELVVPPRLIVTPEELGRENAFLPF